MSPEDPDARKAQIDFINATTPPENFAQLLYEHELKIIQGKIPDDFVEGEFYC